VTCITGPLKLTTILLTIVFSAFWLLAIPLYLHSRKHVPELATYALKLFLVVVNRKVSDAWSKAIIAAVALCGGMLGAKSRIDQAMIGVVAASGLMGAGLVANRGSMLDRDFTAVVLGVQAVNFGFLAFWIGVFAKVWLKESRVIIKVLRKKSKRRS
jgi:hypothetical protein